jgi:hypothetical protein
LVSFDKYLTTLSVNGLYRVDIINIKTDLEEDMIMGTGLIWLRIGLSC